MLTTERPRIVVDQDDLVRFGKGIKAAREAMDLDQEEVAKRVSEIIGQYSQGQYSDLERAYVRSGKTLGTVPDDAILRALSEVLEIPLSTLHDWLGRLAKEESAVLRDAGVLYTAGWSELPDDAKVDVLKVIERFAGRSK